MQQLNRQESGDVYGLVTQCCLDVLKIKHCSVCNQFKNIKIVAFAVAIICGQDMTVILLSIYNEISFIICARAITFYWSTLVILAIVAGHRVYPAEMPNNVQEPSP